MGQSAGGTCELPYLPSPGTGRTPSASTEQRRLELSPPGSSEPLCQRPMPLAPSGSPDDPRPRRSVRACNLANRMQTASSSGPCSSRLTVTRTSLSADCSATYHVPSPIRYLYLSNLIFNNAHWENVILSTIL